MCGKGWAGSTARGVSTPKIFLMKYCCSILCSSVESESYRTISIPCFLSSGSTLSRRHLTCSSTMGSTRSLITLSCSRGVSSPGMGPISLISSISFKPETRTIKNSSRLLAKTARNFNRSSTGNDSSVASSRTRLKNSNWLKSRLKTDHARKCRFSEESEAALLLFAFASRFVSEFAIGVIKQEAGSNRANAWIR